MLDSTAEQHDHGQSYPELYEPVPASSVLWRKSMRGRMPLKDANRASDEENKP
jgi:hypothetical protein